MTEPRINVDSLWWDLRADPGKLEGAATRWRSMAKIALEASGDLNGAAARVLDDTGRQWKGRSRDTYETHKNSLVATIDGAEEKANAIASALDGAATLLRNRQSDLDTNKADITGKVENAVIGHQISFGPKNKAQSKEVLAAVKAAKTTRSDLNTQLAPFADALGQGAYAWLSISTAWSKYAGSSSPDPFTLPPAAEDGPAVITLPDGTVIVNAGEGDQNVQVRQTEDGKTVITVDGKSFVHETSDVVVRGAGGDDTITVDQGVRTDVTALGGDGDDSITGGMNVRDSAAGHRTVIGGEGDDTVAIYGDHNNISTNAGNDTVRAPGTANSVSTGDGDDKTPMTGTDGYASGGRGDDRIQAGYEGNDLFEGKPDGNTRAFGGGGDDDIDGGSGHDTLDGGEGDDTLEGHGGDDTVVGAQGYDYMDGQDGNDNLSGGTDKDVVYGLDGNDTIHGGDGRDYLEGGENNDRVEGGSAEDVVSGGRGEDELRGGEGDDVLYGGEGRDYADGGDGDDRAYIQENDYHSDVTEGVRNVQIKDNSFIKVEGSEEYQDRVRADLDMLSGSPNGSGMIDALRGGDEDDIYIYEQDGRAWANDDYGMFDSIEIGYDPTSSNWRAQMPHGYNENPPIGTLYHELAHAYDYQYDVKADGEYDDPNNPDTENGERIDNDERQATGLDYDYTGDGRPDPVKGEDNPHPYKYTQNGLLEELGRDPYATYGFPERPR